MRTLAALALASLATACSRSPAEPTGTSRPQPSAPAAHAASAHGAHAAHAQGAHAGSTAGLDLRWTDPPGWQRRPGSNPMRKFEYTIPRSPGDTEDGELVVTSFGQGQGGAINENIDRWVRQFSPDTQSQAQREERKVGDFKVTVVELGGTYNGMAMPGGPAPRPRPRWRLLGAIVETPSTLWFFKLTGPEATAQQARAPFHALLDSVR